MNTFVDDLKIVLLFMNSSQDYEGSKDLSKCDKEFKESIACQIKDFIYLKENTSMSKGKKLALNETVCISEEDLDTVLAPILLKYGSKSTKHVMNKFKCDRRTAVDLIVRYSCHACCEHYMQRIDAFDPCFEKCECLFSRHT